METAHGYKSRIIRNDPMPGYTNIHTSFGLTDNKGNDVGFWYTIFIREFEEDDGRCHAVWYDTAPGTYYAASVCNTRNGKRFSSSTTKVFSTPDEALRYVSEARTKRYKKILAQ